MSDFRTRRGVAAALLFVLAGGWTVASVCHYGPSYWVVFVELPGYPLGLLAQAVLLGALGVGLFTRHAETARWIALGASAAGLVQSFATPITFSEDLALSETVRLTLAALFGLTSFLLLTGPAGGRRAITLSLASAAIMFLAVLTPSTLEFIVASNVSGAPAVASVLAGMGMFAIARDRTWGLFALGLAGAAMIVPAVNGSCVSACWLVPSSASQLWIVPGLVAALLLGSIAPYATALASALSRAER